nr:MAG TPA: hypothetical protein [Caudoviricetes sp.]
MLYNLIIHFIVHKVKRFLKKLLFYFFVIIIQFYSIF